MRVRKRMIKKWEQKYVSTENTTMRELLATEEAKELNAYEIAELLHTFGENQSFEINVVYNDVGKVVWVKDKDSDFTFIDSDFNFAKRITSNDDIEEVIQRVAEYMRKKMKVYGQEEKSKTFSYEVFNQNGLVACNDGFENYTDMCIEIGKYMQKNPNTSEAKEGYYCKCYEDGKFFRMLGEKKYER